MGLVASSRITVAVAVALGTAVPACAVRAQEPPEAGAPLEVIIVTATRREASVQDVPFNMVALGPESLEKLRVTELAELTRAVPGLYLSNQGRAAATC